MGVAEYWRFDYTGVGIKRRWRATRWRKGIITPPPVHRTEEGHYRSHSLALNLTLCWEDGLLRFWNPVSQHYLTTGLEERAARPA